MVTIQLIQYYTSEFFVTRQRRALHKMTISVGLLGYFTSRKLRGLFSGLFCQIPIMFLQNQSCFVGDI